MLSIGKLGHGQADYYLQAVGQGIEDYYTGRGEAPGRWLGTGSTELHLSGKVEADALRAVLSGDRPDSSGPLTYSAQGQRRVPGFDLTFSAPKSVSLLFGLAEPTVSSTVRDAHEAAVEAALGYMQRRAATGRRGQGGAISVPGNGFIAAGFRHRTSRAGDPQLHTHVLVANLTRGHDGRWTALDARRLYIHARTAGFLYQAQLRLELTSRLGVEWTPVRNGVAELDGIPPALRRAFSRRRAEIESELDARGETSAGAAQIAALHTRRTKDYAVPADKLAAEWCERALQLGFEPRSIEQLLHRTEHEPPSVERVAAMQRALTSPLGLTQQRSSFTRRDVVQAWAAELRQGGSVPEIERRADALLASNAVVALARDPGAQAGGDIRRSDGRLLVGVADEHLYSTPEILALEAGILKAASEGQGAGHGRVGPDEAQRVLEARPELSEEQAAMVTRLLTDGDQIAFVVGKAGTGKTYALDAARQAWQQASHSVIGGALARRAALELRDGAGIDATSIHALLADLREHPDELLDRRTVLIVDEAGMVGTRQLAELVHHTQDAGAKLVLVGDPRQLPEIDAGGAFRALTIRGMPIRLEENRRQREHWERDALQLLRGGRAASALATYHEHGRLVIAPTAPIQRERMIEDWWSARDCGRDSIMIAMRRADVADLNDRARARMADAGRLGTLDLQVHGKPIAVGDEIVCLRNHPGIGVTNGTQGTVTAIDRARGSLTLRERTGRELQLPSTYLQSSTERGGASVEYAYALTGHKAQGVTVDEALVLGSEALYREWGYVAMSRGRQANRLYLVSGEPELDDPLRRDAHDHPVDAVTRGLARSNAQASATDAVQLAAIERMTTPQLKARQAALRRATQVQRRRERRDQALAEQDARRWGHSPPPPLMPPRSSAIDEQALIADELDRRRRPPRIALLVDPPSYLLDALGPVPEQLAGRRDWRTRAERIEDLREQLGFTDKRRAVPEEIHDPALRRAAEALRSRHDAHTREPEPERGIER